MARERLKQSGVLCGALLMMLSVYGRSAYAQSPSGFSITVRAPEDAQCPSERALVRAVEARVGVSSARASGQPTVAIAVEIERMASEYRALVRVADPAATELGRRELRSEGPCELLSEMLTLVIAASVGITQPPPSAATPAAAPDPAPETPTEIKIVHDTGPSRPWAFDLAGSLRVQSGLAISALFGPTVAAWATWGALRLGLSGTWLLPASDTLPTGLALQAMGAYGELNLCGILAHSARAGLAACLAPQLGALRAEASLARSQPRWDALVQLAASVHANLLVVGRVGLTLALGAALPIVYPRYSHVDERGEVRADHSLELGVWGGLGAWVNLQP